MAQAFHSIVLYCYSIMTPPNSNEVCCGGRVRWHACPPNRLPRQMLCVWMDGTRQQGRPHGMLGQRLDKTMRRKLANFLGRAAFSTPQNEIATWHIAAQDQNLRKALLEHHT